MSTPPPCLPLIRAGALASLAAALLMGAMVLVGGVRMPRPVDTARVMLSDPRLLESTPAPGLAWLLTLDSAYLLCSALGWLGLAVALHARVRGPAALVAGLGLLSVGLDFLENEMHWAAAQVLAAPAAAAASDHVGWVLAWHTVQGLSYWPLALAAWLAGVLASLRLRGGAVLFVLGSGGVLAVPLVHVVGPPSAFGWILTWHLGVAWCLMRDENAARRTLQR